jgi:hypothetical protein
MISHNDQMAANLGGSCTHAGPSSGRPPKRSGSHLGSWWVLLGPRVNDNAPSGAAPTCSARASATHVFNPHACLMHVCLSLPATACNGTNGLGDCLRLAVAGSCDVASAKPPCEVMDCTQTRRMGRDCSRPVLLWCWTPMRHRLLQAASLSPAHPQHGSPLQLGTFLTFPPSASAPACIILPPSSFSTSSMRCGAPPHLPHSTHPLTSPRPSRCQLRHHCLCCVHTLCASASSPVPIARPMVHPYGTAHLSCHMPMLSHT